MGKMFKKFLNKLTDIGGSLQTVIAILPAAGILLAVGTIFTNPEFLKMMPFEASESFLNFFNVVLSAGSIIFGNLSLLFAVGVAIGLSNNDGVAGLSAGVGYLVMNVAIGGILGISAEDVGTSNAYASILGIPSLQTGVLGGIIIGVVTSSIYKKFKNVKLPVALEFFSGKRSVPIITAMASFLVGVIMCFIWPPIQGGINSLSSFVANMNSGIAGFMLGFIERLTIPFGMNHVWWPTFWLQTGEYINKAGQTINGDQLIFFAQLGDGVRITAGRFMNGLFVLKMFGMPAATLAMYHCVEKNRRHEAKGILLSGALTSFFSGITEPIEFLFIFNSTILFAIHAVIAGLGFTFTNILGANLGLSFSGGFLDYLFFNILPNQSKWLTIIPVGIVQAIIYYVVFRWAIVKFDIKTPGREDISVEKVDRRKVNDEEFASRIIEALGGKDNITNVNACYSRLRVDVVNPKLVKESDFRALESSGSNIMGNNVQVIYGTRAVSIKDDILSVLSGNVITGEKIETSDNDVNVSVNPMKIEEIKSPFAGRIMSLDKVPDDVFSNKYMGDGFAIEMTGGRVVSPVNGKIISLFPTLHAIGIMDDYKNEYVLHIGLDTVELEGEGFNALKKLGDDVNVGDPIMDVDIEKIKNKGYSLISPIIFTNLDTNSYIVETNNSNDYIQSGDENLVKIITK